MLYSTTNDITKVVLPYSPHSRHHTSLYDNMLEDILDVEYDYNEDCMYAAFNSQLNVSATICNTCVFKFLELCTVFST